MCGRDDHAIPAPSHAAPARIVPSDFFLPPTQRAAETRPAISATEPAVSDGDDRDLPCGAVLPFANAFLRSLARFPAVGPLEPLLGLCRKDRKGLGENIRAIV